MRFYEPDYGEILVDGVAIQTLDIDWLRKNVTLVQQQSVLFNETIFRNIVFGIRNPERIRKEEVRRAIDFALLRDTIQDLPQSLDTFVGNGGNAMSGGQKQRVAIARARLRDTPILILDEATSALDYASKVRVMDAIRDWRREKTTIIITHDISQIRERDFVYVLEKGVVIQEGIRHALERASKGPLKLPGETSVSTLEKQLSNSPDIRHRSKSLSAGSDFRRPSVISHDPMDIQFRPRKSFIRSVFIPKFKESKNALPSPDSLPHLSPRLITPLSPIAFSFGRMSVAHRTSTSQTNRTSSQPAEATDGLTLEAPFLPDEMELAEMEASNPGLGIRYPNNPDTVQPSSNWQGPFLDTGSSRIVSAAILECNTNSNTVEKEQPITPIKKILLTIWPTLTWRKRIVLVCGFVCAALHAAATPAFSWVFSKLLSTFFSSSNRSQESLTWSLLVLGVAAIDSSASYCMHFLLEYCGQAWVDALRIQAMKHILDQPRMWFDKDKNGLSRLTDCLDRNAEEMKNLLGRFAGFVFVAVTMVSIAIVWSLVISLKLTLVGLASGPFMYGVTRSFEAVSGKWEGRSNDAGAAANSIFSEAFGNIRTVRALTLENYFCDKHRRATEQAKIIGLKRAVYSGLFFGLSDSGIIFVTGKNILYPVFEEP